MTALIKRVFAYIRVSTEKQSLDQQRADILAYCARVFGPDIEVVFVEEVESAAKTRPKLDALCKDLDKGDVLVVWALDRLERSMTGMVWRILDLDKRGIRLVSMQESWIDLQGPVRQLLISVFAWVAEQERLRIGERTRMGLARVKREGSKSGQPVGRPKVPEAVYLEIRDLIQSGMKSADACNRVKYDLPGGRKVTINPATFRKWQAKQRAALIAQAGHPAVELFREEA